MASLSVLHILRTIKERGSISRTELQQRTALSWGTITNTTRELLNRNLIREEGAVQTKAGRKPVVLRINPETHAIVGLFLSPHLLQCVTLDLAGETLWSGEREYEMTESPEQVLGKAAELITEALRSPEVTGRKCLGVGVAAQGALDVAAGVMNFAPRMDGWKNVAIRDFLAARVGESIVIEHDPDCLALAERWFGAAGGAEDVLCLLLSDGIGMGILLGGEIFRGSQGMAGEFGHITVDPDGPLCACGNQGCVEAYCSTDAVKEAVRKDVGRQSEFLKKLESPHGPTVHDLVQAARQGDEAAKGAFERMGRYLGIGVANAIDLFNPSLVVVGGYLTEASDFFVPAMQEQIHRRTWKHSRQETRISQLGPRAVAKGACGAVLQSLFDQVAAPVAAAGNGEGGTVAAGNGA